MVDEVEEKVECFIQTVRKCVEEGWKDSDIESIHEKIFEFLAEHYQECEKCRKAFNDWLEDSEEYIMEDEDGEKFFSLKDFESWFFTPAACIGSPEGWVCEKGMEEWKKFGDCQKFP